MKEPYFYIIIWILRKLEVVNSIRYNTIIVIHYGERLDYNEKSSCDNGINGIIYNSIFIANISVSK